MSTAIQSRHHDALDTLRHATAAITARKLGVDCGWTIAKSLLILDRLVAAQLVSRQQGRPLLHYILPAGHALLETLPEGTYPPRRMV